MMLLFPLFLLISAVVSSSSKQCGTYISPCQQYINKVYQFIGPSEGPSTQLITNLNFYANEMCVKIASSFVTHANLTLDGSNDQCDYGFHAYTISYDQLFFVVHNITYMNLFNITCNVAVEEERLYDVLNDELACQQDGLPFFDVYKTHVPSVQHSCVSLTDIDYYAKRNGTRNIRLSDNGCTDIQEEESEL